MNLNATHWNALRRLLLGESVRPEDSLPEIAKASVRGGVLRLAVEQEPRLESWASHELSRIVHQDILLEQAEEELSQTLSGCHGQILRLKGTASAYSLYSEPGFRERRDIDLLVAAKGGRRVVEKLMRSGWKTLPQNQLPWWSRHRAGRYEETMFKVFGGQRVEVDVHHRLCLYRHLGGQEEGLWQRAKSRDGVSFLFPSNEDLLLHTALHGATSGFTAPTKSWFDLHLLCETELLDWDLVVHLAHEWQVPTACWAGLYVAESYFGSPVPTSVLHRLKPPKRVRRTMTHLLSCREETPLAAGPLRDIRRQVVKLLALGGERPWELVVEHARLRMIPSE